jgi:hypothetical protein
METKADPSATKLLINNHCVASEFDETFATTNPSTGEEICQVAAADAVDVNKAVHASRMAFEKGIWREMHRRSETAAPHSRRPYRNKCRRTCPARIPR